jgi:hypothetical protein
MLILGMAYRNAAYLRAKASAGGRIEVERKCRFQPYHDHRSIVLLTGLAVPIERKSLKSSRSVSAKVAEYLADLQHKPELDNLRISRCCGCCRVPT